MQWRPAKNRSEPNRRRPQRLARGRGVRRHSAPAIAIKRIGDRVAAPASYRLINTRDQRWPGCLLTPIYRTICQPLRPALQWRMPALARRRSEDHREECWHVYIMGTCTSAAPWNPVRGARYDKEDVNNLGKRVGDGLRAKALRHAG
jgi:hypothetical protein